MSQWLVAYDLETKELASNLPGGWANKKGMGISVLSVYCPDFLSAPMLFDDHNYKTFLQQFYWNSEITLISYNGLGFDNKIIEACWIEEGLFPPEATQKKALEIDLLAKIWEVKESRFIKGCNLNDVATATLGQGKAGNGEDAPNLFKERKFADLHNYCISDTILTYRLAMFAKQHGYVSSPIHGQIDLNISWAR